MPEPSAFPIALRRADAYDAALAPVIAELLRAATAVIRPGERVLVKPNLVAPTNAGLSTTHPAVVAAACQAALEAGAKVTVGDSPAFGSAGKIAAKTGLDRLLAHLGVPLVTLGRPVPVRTGAGTIGVARQALEADRLFSLPKLKAHNQLRLTLAVKNLFGCVVGFRKALAHACHGDKGNRFERLIVDVMQALPPTVSLVDGVEAMHERGPTGGRPIRLGLLAAGTDPAALDTALYGLLGATPSQVPLWREAIRQGLPGADPDRLAYPLDQPDAFDCSGFILPSRLDPVSFHPVRLLRGRLKSLWLRLR